MKIEISAVALVCGLALGAAPAMAASPCKVGEPAIVRVSKISPKGSMAGFKKAVADHIKWYRDHGYTKDRQVIAAVMTFDPVKKVMLEAPDQVMTIHTHSTDVPLEKHDAGWAAYVAEYRANSDIATETLVCLPNER